MIDLDLNTINILFQKVKKRRTRKHIYLIALNHF